MSEAVRGGAVRCSAFDGSRPVLRTHMQSSLGRNSLKSTSRTGCLGAIGAASERACDDRAGSVRVGPRGHVGEGPADALCAHCEWLLLRLAECCSVLLPLVVT